MRRFTAVAVLSVVLVVGGAVGGSPAGASSGRVGLPGVEDVVVRQGVISGAELLARAERERDPYGAEEAAVMRKAPCRWYERQQGRRASRHGRWLIWVKVRLHWCYDGYEVVSADARYRSYSYNRSVWRWRGWAKKRLTHTSTWSSVTAQVQGRFHYTGNGYTYKPYATVMGAFDGSYRWWAGG